MDGERFERFYLSVIFRGLFGKWESQVRTLDVAEDWLTWTQWYIASTANVYFWHRFYSETPSISDRIDREESKIIAIFAWWTDSSRLYWVEFGKDTAKIRSEAYNSIEKEHRIRSEACVSDKCATRIELLSIRLHVLLRVFLDSDLQLVSNSNGKAIPLGRRQSENEIEKMPLNKWPIFCQIIA